MTIAKYLISPLLLLAASSTFAAGEFEDYQCNDILQTAYSPGMAVFSSCDSRLESVEDGVASYQLIIHLQGGILGTPYVLKGRMILDGNAGYFKTRWSSWNSPLRPIERTERIDVGTGKWDF